MFKKIVLPLILLAGGGIRSGPCGEFGFCVDWTWCCQKSLCSKKSVLR